MMKDTDEKTELRLDESNELFFKISIHGAEKSPDIIRLVCEAGDIAYSFIGKPTGEGDVVRFVVPPMNNNVKRGQIYESRVEVIVDNHYFVPVKFNAEFTEPVKVVAESMAPAVKKPSEAAKPISVQATRPMSRSQYTSLRDKYQLKK
jgi:hypothetical protein